MSGRPALIHEDWRWFDRSVIDAAVAVPANDTAPDASAYWLDAPGPRLLFVDGAFVAEASTPGPVEVAAARDIPGGHSLGDQAAREARTGYALTLGATHAAGMVQVVHIATGPTAHLSNRIVMAADATASIVETYAGPGWSNVAAHIALGDGARLMRTTRVLKSGGAHTDFTHMQGSRASSYAAVALVTGCMASRIESVVHPGEHGFAEVGGVLLARGAERLDAFIRMRHDKPHGTSRQVWRSVADDRAVASVAGRVEVAHGAQKTDAEQSVKALLLARTATANAKPELEIFADDVKCAHGATVGELNRDALFYLQSRGVDPAGAKALLTRAFLGDALDRIGDETVREAVTADAVAWLEAPR